MAFTISFAIYTLLIVVVGVYSARYARRSDADFFLAGRSLGPWVAALSASASSESGWVTLGLVSWAFISGVSAYWIIPGCLLGFIFNWFFLAARLRDASEKVGALTLPDLFAFSFREKFPLLRILSVIVILTAMWLYVAAQFNAAGKAFTAAFENLQYWQGVGIGAVIVLIYTILGGFRAACWTDFLQGIVMVGTLVIFPLFLLSKVGGYDWILPQLDSVGTTMTNWIPLNTGQETAGKAAAMFAGFLLGHGALGINFGYPGQPHVLVRFMAMRSRKDAIIGGVVSVCWAAMVYWGAVTIGLVVRALTIDGAEWTAPYVEQLATNSATAGETGLVLSAKFMIPGILSGMVLAAVLAAICSTADSQLVVAASSGANDLYTRLVTKSREKAHMIINRSILFLIGIGAVLMALDEEKGVYKFVLTYGWAVLGASFGPQMILLLLWKRASYVGCLLGMFTGFTVAIIWPLIYTDVVKAETGIEIYNLPLAFICAFIVNVIFSLICPTSTTGAGENPE